MDADLAVVRDLISSGDHRDAAEHFVEHIALGPGTWDQLPEPFRAVLEANASTYLDELADPTTGSIDAAALATTTVPVMLTHGTESPELFPAVIAELVKLMPKGEWKCSEELATSPTPPIPTSGSLVSSRSTSSVPTVRTRRLLDPTRPDPTRPDPTRPQ